MNQRQSRSLVNSGHLTRAQAHALSGSVQKAKRPKIVLATVAALLIGIVIGFVASQALHLAQDARWRMMHEERR